MREQFARLHTRLDDMIRWQVETTQRLVAIERHIAGVHRDATLDAEDLVNARESFAAPAARLERIEKRLGLVP